MTDLPAIFKPASIVTIEDADWMDHLSDQIQSIIVEAGFIITWTRVMMYWHIGHAINDEHNRQKDLYAQDPTRPKPVPLRRIFERVQNRLPQYNWLIGHHQSNFYRAVDFAVTYPTEESLDDLPEGKATSWRKICLLLLPRHTATPKTVIVSQPSPPLREQLATLAHDQWTGWMDYLFSKCTPTQDGTAIIPAWAVAQWTRQMNTSYEELSEPEKESDRKEADKVLAIIARKEQS